MNKLAMIVAAAENDVIGINGDLPWQLSADLRRFKRLTMGHHIIMGRKTFDSIGRLLPGRTTVIVTRQSDFECDGALIANSIEEAIALCGEDDLPFVTGGAEIYRLAIPFVSEIHLTRVHTEIDGDTDLPEIAWDDWTLVEEIGFQKDEKNNFDYSFQTFTRS
ncbi:MAG: dihydrofolate reductase [Mariniblastus sp.]